MKSRLTFRSRMLLTLLACLLPMIIGITLLFWESLRTLSESEASTLEYTAQDIAKTLDRYNYGVYNVSDAFSTDERLLQVLDRDYSESAVARQYAVTYTNGSLFESYSRLVQQKKIDAIYVVRHNDVLDFLDYNQQTDILLDKMQELDVNATDKYGKFYMYPLQENFLTTGSYGEVRRDHVIIGSRRVYSAIKSGYPYVHIFAIEEQTLYDLYELQARHLGAEVYVVDAEGGLISATNEQAVADCAVPASVASALVPLEENHDAVVIDGKLYNVARAGMESTDWMVYVMVPGDVLTAGTSALYVKTIAVISICLGIFAICISIFYRRFMMPMTQLEESMRQVDAGNLKAYVRPGGTAEVVQMMESYNAMLDSIRNGLEQQMEMERHKQDLEMQVLTSQINPHFLYNTLETIVWKAGEAGRYDIGKIAASLGKLYRISISGGLFVPLSRELDHVQMYMNIQQSRYGNKVSYDVRLHHCDDTQVEVLKLILQPVVENSLLYGTEGLEHPMQIRIGARHRGSQLILTVTDNGIGMDDELLERVQQQIVEGCRAEHNDNRRSSGIGLHNIQARLQLYAGEESKVMVWSRKGIGTNVTLILPWRGVDADS